MMVGSMIIFVFGPLILLGLTMYAYYYDCDPLTNGQIKSPDQVNQDLNRKYIFGIY